MRFIKLFLPALVAAATLYSPLANARFFWQKDPVKVSRNYVSAAYGSYNTDGEEIDTNDRYHELGIGVKLSNHFGVEAIYSDLGKMDGGIFTADFSGVSALIVGYYPITSYADAYIKGGIFFSKVNLVANNFDESFKDEQPTFGAGVNIMISDVVRLFGEFSQVGLEFDEGDTPSYFEQETIEATTVKVGLKLMF